MSRGPKVVIALDSVEARLDRAQVLGAEAFNYQTQMSDLKSRVMTLTKGRGADAVVGGSIKSITSYPKC